jgi:DNA-binding SARP family transcriptional activator
MDIRVLGPLQITQDGESIVPTATKPRKLLGLLALYPNRVVPISALIEELWEQSPPRSVLTTLQTYILQIRNLITAASGTASPPNHAKCVLIRQFSGYRLNTGGRFSDAQDFEHLAAVGHRALEERRYEAASDVFRKATQLWRGNALVDVQPGPLLDVEITRLEEARLSILSCSVEADLRLGRHHWLLGELAGLAAQNPLHEHIQMLYMLALYRSGRRDRALDVYGSLRRTLNRELGLEPSEAVRRMQHSILTASPALDHEIERSDFPDPLDQLAG